jgi:hypothetical protein
VFSIVKIDGDVLCCYRAQCPSALLRVEEIRREVVEAARKATI